MKNKNEWKRRAWSDRRYLWRIIRRTAGRCGMASWGLPFEAIAAWMLTEDRDRRKRK